MRVLFLNQYFPPDPAPTGLLFGEIAEELRARGHEVIFVSSGQEYRAGQKLSFRWVREAWALVRMFAYSTTVGSPTISPPRLAMKYNESIQRTCSSSRLPGTMVQTTT